jgi:hypothetical protein
MAGAGGHAYTGAGSTDMEVDGVEAAASGGSTGAVAVAVTSALDPSGLVMDSTAAHDLVISPTTGAAAALAQMSGSNSNNGTIQPAATIVKQHVQHRPPLLGGSVGAAPKTGVPPAMPTGLEGAPLELAALLTQVTTSVLPLVQGGGVTLSASPPTLSSRMSLNAAAAGSPTNSQHLQQSQLHSRLGDASTAAQGAGSRSPERHGVVASDVAQLQPTSSRPSNKRASSFEEVEDVVASRPAPDTAAMEEADDMLGVAAVASLLGLKSGLGHAPGSQLPPSLLSAAVAAHSANSMEADGAVKVERAATLSLPPLSTLTPANSVQGPGISAGLESGSPMAGRAAARAWTVPTVAQQMQQARKRAALEAGNSGTGGSATHQGGAQGAGDASTAAAGLGGRSGSASGSGSGSEQHDSPQVSVGAAVATRQLALIAPTPRNSASQAAAAGGDLSQLLMGLSGAYHTAPHANPSALLQGLSSTGSLPSAPSASLQLAPAPITVARAAQAKPPTSSVGAAPALPPLTSSTSGSLGLGPGISPGRTPANSRIAAVGVDLSQQASLSSALHMGLMLGRPDTTMSEASAAGVGEEALKPAPAGSAGSSSPRVQLGVMQAVRRPRQHSSPAPAPAPQLPVLPPLGAQADPLQPLYAAVVLAASQALLAQESTEPIRIASQVVTTAVQGFGRDGTVAGSATNTHVHKANSSTSSVTTRPIG